MVRCCWFSCSSAAVIDGVIGVVLGDEDGRDDVRGEDVLGNCEDCGETVVEGERAKLDTAVELTLTSTGAEKKRDWRNWLRGDVTVVSGGAAVGDGTDTTEGGLTASDLKNRKRGLDLLPEIGTEKCRAGSSTSQEKLCQLGGVVGQVDSAVMEGVGWLPLCLGWTCWFGVSPLL